VRGPNVFAGYWNDPEATARAVDSEGWLHTGDVAVADDDGALRIVDRQKDLIIVSGFNVFPAEVEDALLEHDGVEHAAVVGVPAPNGSESIVAYVVAAQRAAPPTATQLTTHVRQRLARYKVPSRFEFVDELPATFAGKVLRRALRDTGAETRKPA
jgi:long-chain acyl-CoA synthetase